MKGRGMDVGGGGWIKGRGEGRGVKREGDGGRGKGHQMNYVGTRRMAGRIVHVRQRHVRTTILLWIEGASMEREIKDCMICKL